MRVVGSGRSGEPQQDFADLLASLHKKMKELKAAIGCNWIFDITFLFGLQYLGVRVSLAPVIFASLAPVAT